MGGKDSPPPTFADSTNQQQSQQQCGLITPPFSPMKRKSSTVSSSSYSSAVSTPLSSPTPLKRSPSIRYVPRSKSSVNLEGHHHGEAGNHPAEPLRDRSAGSISVSSSVQTYVDCLAPQALKCVLVGDSGVGKTSLIMSYTTEKFRKEHTPTIYDKFTTSMAVYGKKINLTLCDTSGSDDFGHLRPLCYPQIDVALICFSVTDYSSFENARNKWIKELKRNCSNDVPIILIGTNIDTRDNGTLLRDFKTSSKKYVSRSEGLKAALSMKAMTYIECSSKTSANVKAVFDEVIATALEMNSSRQSRTPQCTVGCSIL